MPKKKDTSWGSVADWYNELLNMEGTYQSDLIWPNLLRLIEPKKGDNILDIACGQGFFSHKLSETGADILGVDISAELVKLAQKNSKPNEKFITIPADKMAEEIPADKFDKAIIVLALQNIENLNGALAQSARALKTGGRLFIVLNHPAFRNPKQTFWGFDEEKKIQYRRVDEYLSESKTEIDMSPGKSKKEMTISFHRPLQVYFKALVKSGFNVARLEEWNSHKKSESGPRQNAEDKARKEIPLFLLIEAVKQGKFGNK